MAWIESHQSLSTHRKTRKLAKDLGVSKPTAIGHLHLLWWWCMDNAQDGDLSSIDPDEIAEVSMWEGSPGDFLQALITSGFMDCGDDGRTVLHDWHDYAGKLIEKREADRKRKAEGRRKDVQDLSVGRPADKTRTSSGQDTERRMDGAGTVPTVPTNQPFTPTEGDERPAYWIIRKTGEPVVITEGMVSLFLAKYPGVDVRNICRRLMDYTRKHPRPEKDEPIAWVESKLAEGYEALQAKRLNNAESTAAKVAFTPHPLCPEIPCYEQRPAECAELTAEQYDQVASAKQQIAERRKVAANG